jgi:hypothetical protein
MRYGGGSAAADAKRVTSDPRAKVSDGSGHADGAGSALFAGNLSHQQVGLSSFQTAALRAY